MIIIIYFQLYSEPKALITSTSDLSAGTMILHHPHRDPENYNLYDKNLKDICCSNGYCGKFYQQRPINNCNGYTGIQNSKLASEILCTFLF